MLRYRIASGVIGVPVLVGVAVYGGWPFLFAVMVGAVLGTVELFGMFRAAGYRPVVVVTVPLAILFVVERWIPGHEIAPISLSIGGVLALLMVMRRESWDHAIADWALTLAPAVYIGGLLQFFVPLRLLDDGAFWVLAVLVCAWFADSVAYFVGRRMGRHRLAPRVSPAKSVEGAVAGVTASIAVAGIAAVAFGQPAARLLIFGLVVGICAVVGDLLESFLKRLCGVKDSGTLIPGHGGALDRMDSWLLAAAGGYFAATIGT